MQFVCNQRELLDAVNIVTKAMPTRTSIPLIEGIRLKGEAGRLELFCTDLKLSIKSSITANFEEAFSCVMPGKLFSEVVRRLPSDDVHITVTEANEGSYRVKIVCQDSRTTLTALDAAEFPEATEAVDENAIQISEGELRSIIRQTVFAVAQDNTRPVFTGELVELQDQKMNLVALDGFKFAMRTVMLDAPCAVRSCIVPGRALLEIMRILDDSEEKVLLHVQGKNFMLQKGETRVMTRLLEGDFIRYEQIIPHDATTTARVNVDALRAAISRAELIAQDDRVNLVTLHFEPDVVIVTSNSQAGDVLERVACIMQGQNLDIAFNIRYLSETLRALECEEVVLQMTTSVGACVMKPADDAQFLYLVLPVQV